jgi:putative SOS response-associated peptidase YedK
MCGRDYTTFSEEELYFRYLNRKGWVWSVKEEIPEFSANYNRCPTQIGLVLSVHEKSLQFRTMRWGLVPAWAKSVKDADKYSMINAKAEEIHEKRSYKAAYQKRRCIVPASGFFEWKRGPKTKQPFAIHLKDSAIMSLAGIWESWTDKENNLVVESYCLLTTSANTAMAAIHHRMPVILSAEDEQRWLDPLITEHKTLSPLLKPCPSEWIQMYEISTLVNSPKNNLPQVLVPDNKQA